MGKIGILTYHYSNNYGGVLQSYALFKYLDSKGFDVEIINYIPMKVNLESKFYETGMRKNILKIEKEDFFPISTFLNRVSIKRKYSKKIVKKFDDFRNSNIKLSKAVNEKTLPSLLNDYETIVVGSDQIWSPGERNRPTYFLDYNHYKGRRVSYAADSTTETVNDNQTDYLKNALKKFNSISVRNNHSYKFVNELIDEPAEIVVDPTLLWNFNEDDIFSSKYISEQYILVYVLGKEIGGSNKELIDRIRKVYGNLKVKAIVIPTRKFLHCDYADELLYDIGPLEWVNLIANASFILTDSFHGTLFSIKYKKPFLAYYEEKLRATRFIDLGTRFNIEDFIINTIDELEQKKSLEKLPNFEKINKSIANQLKVSEDFINSNL